MTRYYIRIVLWMVAVLIASVAAVARIFSGLQDEYFRPDLGEQIVAFGEDLGDRLEGKPAPEAAEVLGSMGDSMLFDARIVAAGGAAGDGGADAAPFLVRPAGADYLVALTPNPDRVKQFKDRQGLYFVASLAAIGLIIGAAGAFAVLPLVRKLRAQERTILMIADGHLDARAPVESADALGRLGERINQMADRIQHLVSRQRELVHAVSHEMRTPCARLGFGLDLLAEAGDDAERSRRIAAMHDDVRELDELLDELLTFLRFDEPGESLAVERFDLHAAAGRIVRKYAPFRDAVRIENTVPDPFPVDAHPRHFNRALENLVANAVRHARSHVRVSACRGAEGTGASAVTLVAVEDDGPGIDPADRERVFEPFYRTDASRDRRSGGAGLGLAIVRRIIDRHRGTVEAGASDLGGARFTVHLPPLPPRDQCRAGVGDGARV